MKKIILIFLLFAIYHAEVMAQKKIICHNAGDFHEGMAAIQVDEKWGFIDTLGNMVIPPQFISSFIVNNAPSFCVGLAAVLEQSSQQMIYINKKGEIAFDQKYIRAYNFHEGIAFAEPTIFSDFRVLINKRGFIDTKGNVKVNFLYRNLRPMSGGMAYFEKWDEKTKKTTKGFIDKSGKEVIVLEQPKF